VEGEGRDIDSAFKYYIYLFIFALAVCFMDWLKGLKQYKGNFAPAACTTFLHFFGSFTPPIYFLLEICPFFTSASSLTPL
jgi:hypothetical protein